KNPSPVRLLVESIRFEDGSDPAFSFDSALPSEVSSAVGVQGEAVSIRFSPQVQSPVTARLIIESDGENLNDDEAVVIEFVGGGLDRGQPAIEVDPAEC